MFGGLRGGREEGVVPIIDAFEDDAIRLHLPCDVQKFLGDFAGWQFHYFNIFWNALVCEIIALHGKEDLAFALTEVHDFTIFGECATERVLSVPVDGHDDESVDEPFVHKAFPINAACDEQFVVVRAVRRKGDTEKQTDFVWPCIQFASHLLEKGVGGFGDERTPLRIGGVFRW